ncbi:P-loop containing nucleoside triphosphate hydrolase protein [Basidiobolus meristosporus CBS 931.73]|uniref:p-loop containing nucleoside triphosphate hydrolase protein n=1 Tax=Basidiobolus meristosporus CBS 931.73 TaxID=1314790 RepID=A0A1Y1YMW9_9FUNG|nr:P-loop containing nucleoside triphosphate hydrolase protein [Basidiobolus meristosporus CBS 931.73]|eukprot:ORX99367.1 P-loop containing nucleoside triphosphate hydrolase protein [Basidiobolus meristosporus CBS 931.73]
MLAVYGSKVKYMLTTQYRMHDMIMKFPSMEFYEDKLVAHASVRERLLSQIPDVEETDNTLAPLVFIDTAHAGMNELAEAGDSEKDGDSKYNEGEVTVVVEHVKSLIEAGLHEEDIAVITPYNAQVKMLTLALKEAYPELEIGSVDGFQGREKEAVIFSMVRSNDSGEVGFLSDSRRLNVAITRPKRHLCVIGDSETVGMKDEFLRKYCEWVMDNGEVRYAEY